MKKHRAGILSLICMTGAFLALRYPLRFLHGMKEWPVVLFVVGVLVIAMAGLIRDRKKLPIFTAGGYVLGFAAGYLLQWDYGIGRNNLWLIWSLVFLTAILAGAGMELFSNRRTTN